jgi:hypothetical protein
MHSLNTFALGLKSNQRGVLYSSEILSRVQSSKKNTKQTDPGVDSHKKKQKVQITVQASPTYPRADSQLGPLQV